MTTGSHEDCTGNAGRINGLVLHRLVIIKVDRQREFWGNFLLSGGNFSVSKREFPVTLTAMVQGQPQGRTKLQRGFRTMDQGLTKDGQTRTYQLQVTRTWNRKGSRIFLNLEKFY